jgi:hypothetical protein
VPSLSEVIPPLIPAVNRAALERKAAGSSPFDGAVVAGYLRSKLLPLEEPMPVSTMGRKPRRVTRVELYAMVWRTPMSRLAEEFGISGNGLTKICNRLDVPLSAAGSLMSRCTKSGSD